MKGFGETPLCKKGLPRQSLSKNAQFRLYIASKVSLLLERVRQSRTIAASRLSGQFVEVGRGTETGALASARSVHSFKQEQGETKYGAEGNIG